MAHLVYIPREFLELRDEIHEYHPILLQKLKDTGDDLSLGDAIGIIAAHIGIILEGNYSGSRS